MNRKTVEINKDLFDEIMFTDYLEWGTLLDDNIDNFWIENDDFRNNLIQVKTPTQLDNWYKEFENMYRNGQLNDDVHVAMYEFLNLTPRKYFEKEITKGYQEHVQKQVDKVNAILEKMKNDGVELLEFQGYSTSEEDFEHTDKYDEEYGYLFDTVVDKVEKDLNSGFFEYGLTLVWFVVDGKDKDLNVKLRDDNNDYYFKVNDILTSNKYTEKMK
ncbi:hypothetical protein CP360_06880 [Lactobacillus sp. UMNPBX9]|nr:hypothetical protein CP360_06880 [Lactobacillus sp. UMNPBX9]